MAGDLSVEHFSQLRHEDLHAVLQLIEAARAVDGSPALSEHALLHLVHHHEQSLEHHQAARMFVARLDGHVVGFSHLDASEPEGPPTGELVVDVKHRRHGIGSALVMALLTAAPEGLMLWAHGEHPAAEALANQHGFHRARSLWQMRLTVGQLAQPSWPIGVTVRTFLRSDAEDWLAVNARAFAQHPEQGLWSAHDLAMRMAEPWFDPGGFFLAERAGELIGFHWTKVHELHGEEAPVGEVYVVGVEPSAQGSGLGKALTLLGLQHLKAHGIGEVLLYVDSDNAPAIAVYEHLGFIHRDTDVCFRLP